MTSPPVAEICTLYCSMQNETKYAISSSLSFIAFICSVVLQRATFEMPQNKDSIKVRIYEVKESLFAAYKNDRIDAFNLSITYDFDYHHFPICSFDGHRMNADCTGLFYPRFYRKHEIVVPCRIFNCTEFGTIKNGIIQHFSFYFSLPTHPLLLPQQLGNRAIAE